MDRDDAVWGLVGGFSFLVLAQAYELLSMERIGVLPKLGVAVVVTFLGAVLAGQFRRRLRERASENGRA